MRALQLFFFAATASSWPAVDPVPDVGPLRPRPPMAPVHPGVPFGAVRSDP